MLKKLVTKIFYKEKYVIYFENLRPGLTNRNRKKNEDKDGKALFKLIKNSVYEKTMENWNRIDVRFVSNRKGHWNQAICHTKYLTMT